MTREEVHSVFHFCLTHIPCWTRPNLETKDFDIFFKEKKLTKKSREWLENHAEDFTKAFLGEIVVKKNDPSAE